MYDSKETPSERHARVLSNLCKFRGTSRLNELEQQANEAVRTVCGRRGIESSDDMHNVMRYISRNGYKEEDKPYLHEIVVRRFYRKV